MTIALGADHRGFALKEKLALYLKRLGFKVDDRGTFTPERVDYPDFALAVAEAVARGQAQRGILICATGIGMSIAANKVRSVRAALCLNTRMARLAREHNNANVLCLGADFLTAAQAKGVVRVFLGTDFAGGRHSRRVRKIEDGKKKGLGDEGMKTSSLHHFISPRIGMTEDRGPVIRLPSSVYYSRCQRHY